MNEHALPIAHCSLLVARRRQNGLLTLSLVMTTLLLALMSAASRDVLGAGLYTLLVCAQFFTFAGAASIGPATSAALFGTRHLAANYGLLVTNLVRIARWPLPLPLPLPLAANCRRYVVAVSVRVFLVNAPNLPIVLETQSALLFVLVVCNLSVCTCSCFSASACCLSLISDNERYVI